MEDTFKLFHIDDGFMGKYVRLVQDVVIPYQEKVLNDQVEGAAKSHAIENFRMAAEKLETGCCSGEFYGMVFQDSDVAKWLEAAAYSLALRPDRELEARCDEVIEIIDRAQQADGYLNTYFTVKSPDKRWTNLLEAHELYCAGHMIEAAVAFAESTGKKSLLTVMCRMADHIYSHFITQKAPGCPGHPEIELALMRLYHCTGEERYRELAEHFVNVRGADPDYFQTEAGRRDWTVWNADPSATEYNQSHVPVREQKDAVGHAVRAVYLYSGMADVALQTHDDSLFQACRTLWDSITERRMYVTGAIGSAYEGEAFTSDYHLPNDSAYAETCAAIGLVFFARRMLDLDKNSRYADTMERALYNCILAGMELDGTRFFYVNPLETVPGISGETAPLKHALPSRPGWFTCACCPPNVARLLCSIGRYAWSIDETTVYSHLYIGGTLDLTRPFGGSITVQTAYPYDGDVTYRFQPADDSMSLTLAIRLPFWSTHTRITLNGQDAACDIRSGYACLTGSFTAADVVTAAFDMSVKRIFADTRIHADSGKAAFSRGPLLYCAEGIDNGDDLLSLQVQKDANIRIQDFDADLLNGVTPLMAPGYRLKNTGALYRYTRPESVPCGITLIPYYTWSNRGPSQMRVWLPESE